MSFEMTLEQIIEAIKERKERKNDRSTIANFRNHLGESLYNGYKRFRGFLNNCPDHGFPPWLALHTFYAGLSERNIDELDIASNRAFQTLHISTAWKLLDTIHRERETFLEYHEEDNPVDYECIERFLNTGRVENLSDNFHLGTNMILQISKTYIE